MCTSNDYIAMYDKKMLWRANLYLDETQPAVPAVGGQPAQPAVVDWNDLHPWNAPASAETPADTFPMWGKNSEGEWDEERWGYNDWNTIETDSNRNSGGQVTSIKAWTRFNGGDVTGHVAYGWGCWDSVGTFNDGLIAQSDLIADGRVDGAGNDLYLGAVFAGLQWNAGSTTAPAESWANYIFPGRQYSLRNGHHYYDYSAKNDNFPVNNGQVPPQIITDQHTYNAESNPRPKVPQLSTFMAFGPAANTFRTILADDDPDQAGSYDYSQVDFSLGIDCSGFAHRITKYYDSLYWVANNDGDPDAKFGTRTFAGQVNVGGNWETRINTSATRQIHAGGWKIESVLSAELAQRTLDREIISHAVPGDILVIGGDHVVIITDLRYTEGSTVITAYSQVQIIHSTRGAVGSANVWRVQLNTWEQLGDAKVNYSLRRMNNE